MREWEQRDSRNLPRHSGLKGASHDGDVGSHARHVLLPPAAPAQDLGNLSANPFAFDSTANAFGTGSPFAPNGINNPFSPYGSPFSNQSATNPFATDAPRLYDQADNYRGKLSANPFDADSTSNQIRPLWLAVLAGFHQQSVRGREPVSLRLAEQSIRQRLADRGKEVKGVRSAQC